MEVFDSNYNSWKREWRSSSKCSKLRIGNRAVRAKFRSLESEIEEFEPSSKLGTGNGGVLAKFEAKFDAWNREWRS